MVNALLSANADAVVGAGVKGDVHHEVLGMRVATSETGAA
jgi:hypothetical protein